MIYTLKDAHPSYRILNEEIEEKDGILYVKADCDVNLPRFQFLRNFSPKQKLFFIKIDSIFNSDEKSFELNVVPMYYNYFNFSGSFSFDNEYNIYEKKFDIKYHFSIRAIASLLHSRLKKLIMEQISQDFKILYGKLFCKNEDFN